MKSSVVLGRNRGLFTIHFGNAISLMRRDHNLLFTRAGNAILPLRSSDELLI
jgi:hypothetical protein